MTTTDPAQQSVDPTDYLRTERYMDGLLEATALHAAFRSGLIDRFLAEEALEAGPVGEARSTHFDVLRAMGVLEVGEGGHRLTPEFRSVLAYRELLEDKLRYSLLIARDIVSSPNLVFGTPREDEGYVERYYRYYRYNRTESDDGEERRLMAEWVRYMTVLTRYEAPAGLARYDFGRHRRMMDVGGNSGEWVLQVLEAVPGLEGVVFDLPGVVGLGADWNRDRPAAERVEFVGGDAFVDPLPRGCDLISFKGVLHDWPDPQARALIEAAWAALEPGGTLMVFERSRVDLDAFRPIPISQLTMLVWSWIFRGPERYLATLSELGATQVSLTNFHLDLPWMILTAVKPAAE